MKCPFFKQVKEAFKDFGNKLKSLFKKKNREQEQEQEHEQCDSCDVKDEFDESSDESV